MKIVQEPERLDARVPLALLGVALVILLLSALLTLAIQRLPRREAPPGGLSQATPAGESAVNVGNAPVQAAWLFEAHGAAQPSRGSPAELNGYAWADRDRGLVRIPIARAKQLWLERQAGLSQPASAEQQRGQP
jgi:hypothetical protein